MIFLFDLDGTIVKTDKLYYKIWTDILSNYSISVTPQFYEEYIQGHNDESVIRSLSIQVSIQEITSLKDKLFIDSIELIEPMPFIENFIEKCRNNNIKMAIITNCSRIVSEKILEHMKIKDYFEFIIIGNECKRPKPYPDPYLCAIEKFPVDHVVVIFEDSKTGILSAKSACPKLLIGIESNYTGIILKQYGADITIKDFNIDLTYIENIVNNYVPSNIVNFIKKSLRPYDYKNVLISDEKLKGGFISDVISVTINDDNKESSSDVIIKLENINENFLSKMANNINLYSREYYFYETLSNHVPIKVPKFYTIVRNNEYVSIGILMENLITKGYTVKTDFDLEDSLFAIKNIAILHSKFWNLKDNVFPGLKDNKISNSFWTKFIQEKWPQFRKKWSSFTTSEIINKLEHNVNTFDELQEKMSIGTLTLCHGDMKSANIFYKNDNGVRDMYFIDWQYITRGKGPQDLVFFMIESFSPNNIKKYYTIFKEYYYLSLNVDYSRESFEEDFRNSTGYFPLFVAVWFGTLSEDELIDKNFPFFFIQRYFHFLGLLL
jgi:HAD superfamily hydrolase (TIGR01509 family)